MIGVGIGPGFSKRRVRIPTPAQIFGTSARFVARPAPGLLTLTGANITALANDGGTAGAMTAGATACTLDSSVLQGVYPAIRTSSPSSMLRVGSGGPTGVGPFHLVALAAMLSQPGGAGNDSSFMLAGLPGNDATHKNSGIGCTSASNGAWLRNGGFGNSVAQGPSITRAIYDAGLHLYESTSDGSTLTMLRDGGKLGAFAGGTDLLSSGEMGFEWSYPLASYGPPDTRIYWAGWFDRALTDTERAALCRYLVHEYQYTAKRFVDAIGDSRTAGHIGAANTTSYIELMLSQWASASSTVYGLNSGITSETTAQIAARVNASLFAHFAPQGGKLRSEYMILRGYTNDAGALISPAQSYANLAGASQAAQARGIRTIISTEHAQVTSNAQNRVDLATFNALVLANSAGADAVADIRALIANYATTNPTTADMPDNTHQSNALLAQEAAVYRAVIDSLP